MIDFRTILRLARGRRKMMFQCVPQLSGIGLAIALLGSIASAASPKARQDAIELVGSVQLHGANVCHIQRAEIHGRTLLYLEDVSKHALTVVDVTNAGRPRVAREIALNKAFGSVEVLGDDAILLAVDSSAETAKVTSLSVVSLDNNGDNSKTTRSFANVTAFLTDDQSGLVYLADQEGLKVLRTKSSTDAALEREFDKRIRYDR
jgi:hypothetical protein